MSYVYVVTYTDPNGLAYTKAIASNFKAALTRAAAIRAQFGTAWCPLEGAVRYHLYGWAAVPGHRVEVARHKLVSK